MVLYFAPMKIYCTALLLLLLLPRIGFSQKIEKYYDYLWHETELKYARFYMLLEKTDSGWHRKDFFMHGLTLQMDGWYEDSATKVASGYFTYAYPNRRVEMTGRYVHDKKQGLWLTYYPDGMMSDSTVYDNGEPVGTSLGWHHNGYPSDSAVYKADGSGVEVSWFDNGNPSSAGMLAAGYKKNGKWQYFHKNGNISAVELYDHDKLVDKQYFEEDRSPAKDTSSKAEDARFPGGLSAWGNYLSRHLYFPPQYEIVNSDKAVVVVSATIDEDGKIQDAYVSTPFYPEFDKIALDVIRRSPNWIPARNHHRKVKYEIRQPVTFSQPD